MSRPSILLLRPALQDRALNDNRLSVHNDGLEKTSQTAISNTCEHCCLKVYGSKSGGSIQQ